MQIGNFIGWILAGRAVEENVHLNLCVVQSEYNVKLKFSRDAGANFWEANVDTQQINSIGQEMLTINNSIL